MPRKADGPGPGAYDTTQGFGNIAKACTFRSRSAFNSTFEIKPGPGEYAPVECLNRTAARCLFGMTTRFPRQHNEDFPGPCEYTPRNARVGQPRRTIGEKLGSKLDDTGSVTPGPGAYSSEEYSIVKPRAASAGFGQGSGRWLAKRLGNIGQDSPGPASYQSQLRGIDKRSPSTPFGTSPRLVEDAKSHGSYATPGPGTYSSREKTRGPRFTMGSRRECDR